jgi:hypothetical protein
MDAAAIRATAPTYVFSSGFDRVVVEGASQATTVDLPWSSRQLLLRRLAQHAEADGIIREFVDAGSSRPVRLARGDKSRLLAVCTSWLGEGADRLPEGIYVLRNALLADQPAATNAQPPQGRTRRGGWTGAPHRKPSGSARE